MNPVRKLRDGFQKSVISFSLLALSFALMPVPYLFDGVMQRICFIFNGLLFWASLISGTVSSVKSSRIAAALYRDEPEAAKVRALAPGLFRFFPNRTASVFDLLLLADIAAAVAAAILKPKSTAAVFIIISIAVFSLSMHCLFNGKIYRLTKIRTYKERKTK